MLELNENLINIIDEVTRDMLTMTPEEFEDALEEAKDDPRYEDILDIIERKQY